MRGTARDEEASDHHSQTHDKPSAENYLTAAGIVTPPDRLKDVETVDEDARARDHAKHTDHRVPAAACAGTAADEKSGPEKQGNRSGQTSRFEASVSTKK